MEPKKKLNTFKKATTAKKPFKKSLPMNDMDAIEAAMKEEAMKPHYLTVDFNFVRNSIEDEGKTLNYFYIEAWTKKSEENPDQNAEIFRLKKVGKTEDTIRNLKKWMYRQPRQLYQHLRDYKVIAENSDKNAKFFKDFAHSVGKRF